MAGIFQKVGKAAMPLLGSRTGLAHGSSWVGSYAPLRHLDTLSSIGIYGRLDAAAFGMSRATLSYLEQKMNIAFKRVGGSMLILDPPAIVAIAALITAISALVWSVRRKP